MSDSAREWLRAAAYALGVLLLVALGLTLGWLLYERREGRAHPLTHDAAPP